MELVLKLEWLEGLPGLSTKSGWGKPLPICLTLRQAIPTSIPTAWRKTKSRKQNGAIIVVKNWRPSDKLGVDHLELLDESYLTSWTAGHERIQIGKFKCWDQKTDGQFRIYVLIFNWISDNLLKFLWICLLSFYFMDYRWYHHNRLWKSWRIYSAT